MKKQLLYSSVLIAAASMMTGCSENAWNDHLDGFEGGFDYTEKITVSYTLSNADYETIGKALEKAATTEAETQAAKAIQANHYFDQASAYPAQVAIPYLLDDTSSDFFIYTNGSVVEASFRQAEEVPEEISQISSAYTYTISNPTDAADIPGMLKTKYPDAAENSYAIVSYLDANTQPAAPSTAKVATKTASAKTKAATTRSDSEVWTVGNTLYKMENGYEGEATVIGTITEITDVSTSYGNATYYISDPSTEDALQVFRGYYLEGEKFTSADQIAVGQTVVVTGKVKNYNGTYEFDSGNSIVTKYSNSMWSVAEALDQIASGYKESGIVLGVVSEITDLNTSYGNATYFIKDALTDEDKLEVYRGYYLDGEKFTSEDQLEVGATVVVWGTLTNYNGTYEFTSSSEILSYSTQSNGGTSYDSLTSNIKDVAVGNVLSATAVVSGQCTRGLILTDNAGSILYYNTAVNLADYPIGTVVDFSGEVAQYNHGFQLTNTATLETVETIDYNYPEPVEYTGAMVTEASQGTDNILAQYVMVEGVVTFSGNYINIAIDGTDVVGSAYYTTDELKEQLVSGSTYKIYGYFTSFTTSYFYIVVTGVEEIIPDVDPYDLTNAIYYYDGSAWAPAEGATVLNPQDYVSMGFTNNNLADPEVYLPLYMKQAYPYALSGDEVFVAYNIMSNSASCDLMVYDGSSWSLNNNNLSDVTAAFTKNDGEWSFTKYLGQAIYNLFDGEELLLDRKYLFVSSSSLCANAVVPSNPANPYGYLLTTPVSISGNQIVMPNEANAFSFLSTYVGEDGTEYTAPEGYFFIQDSNEQFMYLQGTYSSFNLSSAPLQGANTTIDNYVYSAKLNEGGTWTITGKANGRIIYFSSKYSNFAAYDTQTEVDTFPYLYLME